MAVLMRVGLLTALLVIPTGCTARAVNSAEVFKPVTGVVQMEIKIPAGESVQKVQFQVNDKVVGEDADPTDGYKAEIDTGSLEPDVLAKVAAVGVRANGSTVVLRENFILVGPRPEAEGEPLPSDTGDGGNGGTGGTGGSDEEAVGGTTSFKKSAAK